VIGDAPSSPWEACIFPLVVVLPGLWRLQRHQAQHCISPFSPRCVECLHDIDYLICQVTCELMCDSAMQMICCYVYFLYTQRDFGYENHFNKITQRSRLALMQRRQFDQTRFHFLQKELVRWQRYARGLATRRGGG
jgi:hypothetical protein